MTTTSTLPEITDDNGVRVVGPTIHHCGYQTPRKAEMLRWYRNVLGQYPTLEVVPPQGVWDTSWTTNDENHHRMGFVAVPGLKMEIDQKSPGLQHLAWEYASVDDLLESWERMKKLGIEPQFAVNHLITFAFYYRDPDGNLVELLADAWDDHDKSRDCWMNDPRAAANPPGIPVDPGKLLEARRNGISLDDLRERSYLGEFSPDATAEGRVHDFGEDMMDERWKESGRGYK
jgi:catechol-2,3-dioxygenase